jgi:3-dehydroquinate synthase
MKTLHVDLGDRSYPIFIAPDLLGNSEHLTPYIKGNQVCIVSNETVAPLYLEKVKSSLKGFDVTEVILPDGEQYKTLETVNLIFDGLLKSRQNRTTTLIALGGGVVGDMCGFAAASYQRGVNFIQIPTTLLSQVDSSVGGKTGVNHALGKNMIGAFHQPQAVIIDTNTLNTLPDKELSAGIAEVIKYGLLGDKPFLDWLNDNMLAIRERNVDVLTSAIERSCRCKAEIVAADEKEAGIRALLNLGHTFGHAIETHEGYGNWLHGEAVGAGMVMAANLSCRMGFITSEELIQTQQIIEKAGLPTWAPEHMGTQTFIDLMMVDKKVLDGSLRLVLLKALGEAIVTNDFSTEALTQTLSNASI